MLEKVDLLIRHGLVITCDDQDHIWNDADIAIKGSEIIAIGPDLPYQPSSVIDATNHVVLPGLINAHMHETLTRGICEDLPLNRWLEEICFPLDRAYDPEAVRAAAMMNQIEMIRGGVTTFLDIYRYPDVAAEVSVASGLRAFIVPQIIIEPPLVGESVESAEAFVSKWKGRNPLITPGFGPHAPYSCPPKVYKQLTRLAEYYDVPLHTHLAETCWEVNKIKEKYGCSPVEYLDMIGVLNPRLSIAHGVWLTPNEIRLLASYDVGVVYNPTSNMKLASGVAPVNEFLSAGMKVALGTDSNLSNNNLDMFEEMRVGALLQKFARSDASILPCHTMLRIATCGGAEVLKVQHLIGSLEPGKQADIILVDLNQPHLWPLIQNSEYQNLINHLVYSANAADVTHTIVAGKVLMAERQVLTLEMEMVSKMVQEAAQNLLKRARLI
jgi:5-methylthioadenosine/S-adenosylhomocysteine deaminase